MENWAAWWTSWSGTEWWNCTRSGKGDVGMTNMEEIAALAVEAKRRGVRYGELVNRMTPEQRDETFRHWKQAKAVSSRQKKKKRPAAAQR